MRTLQSLAALAAVVTLAAAPAFAQQQPGDNGTDANGPISILKNMQPEPGGTVVRVNGREVDHLRSASYDDITTIVHPGTNTLTLTWSGAVQRFNFKVAFAPTRNNFKNVLVVSTDASRDSALQQAGSRTWSFTIPG